jgi:AraC family transcriptional regulator of adaptative response / DNA-3-methyladenine glycosylase II
VNRIAAVVTTGIYCCPGCGARPLARNVLSFTMPAAAEAAGFRACLRCRPYRIPQRGPAGAPDLVCRAVSLILDGALDGASEDALGRRLGVSARHLRRLFDEHLGVTPDGLARSARAHFARRLLDETDLTVTEVAFATGFGSLRQFNRAFLETFRATPTALRAKRRKSDRLVADGGLALRLQFEGPLDWQAMLIGLAETAVPGVEGVEGETYRRTVEVNGEVGVLELLPGGPDHMVLRAHLPHWEELIHLVARARHIASLDMDLDGPARHLGADPIVGPLLRRGPGVRPPGTWDGYEIGLGAIVARYAGPRAMAVQHALVSRFGRPVHGLAALGLTHAFPSPRTIVGADLGPLDLPPAAMRAMRVFAAAVASGSLKLDRSLRLEQLVRAIEALEAVPPPVAEVVAYRLGEPDAAPSDGLGRGDAWERWRPWRALATTHVRLAPRLAGRRARMGAA